MVFCTEMYLIPFGNYDGLSSTYRKDGPMPTTQLQPTLPPDITMREIEGLFAARKEIVIVWHVDDVKQVRPHLTDEQAWTVLESIGENHDAEYGVCWSTLSDHADSLFPENDKQEAHRLSLED
jgi:hypothetical protein